MASISCMDSAHLKLRKHLHERRQVDVQRMALLVCSQRISQVLREQCAHCMRLQEAGSLHTLDEARIVAILC